MREDFGESCCFIYPLPLLGSSRVYPHFTRTFSWFLVTFYIASYHLLIPGPLEHLYLDLFKSYSFYGWAKIQHQ